MFEKRKKLGRIRSKLGIFHTVSGGLMFSFLVILFTFPFPIYSVTVSFQDGVYPDASYAGTRDTYLDAGKPNKKRGSKNYILIDGAPYDYGTLLYWNVSSITPGTVIQSASITLTAFDGSGSTYELYEMKQDWVESEATWNVYSSGNSWQTAGAQGSNDRGTTILGTITGGTGTHTITLNANGIALVQSWVDNPSSNHGITIQDYGAGDGMDFYSSEFATASWRPMLNVTYLSPGTIESRVSAGNDDAEERNPPNGSMYLTSSDLELVRDGSTDQEIGMRFNNISVPQGATITNAYVQFTVDETSTETTNLVFYGEDIDNAPIFNSTSGNITSRTKTSASVNWDDVPAWTSVGAAGADQRTPDLSSIIQEIVNRSGWSSGNSIVIIVDGTGKRVAESYNGTSGSAPLLHIQYSTGAIGETYYVRTDGDDSNPGTSNTPSGAWRTIQKAANTMVAGDTVLVQPGIYYENVTPANGGIAGNPIIYKAEGTVIMDGQNTPGYAFNVNSKDYIVIDGFIITNWPDGGGTHATVKFTNSDNGVVRNCVIHNTGRDAIYFYGTSSNCIAENNLIYSIDDDGITPKGGNHTIRNNTIYNCGVLTGGGGWAIESANTSGNVYENNIFWENIDNTGGSVTYTYNDYINSVLPGTGNISADPLFVNATGNDFHLSHTASGQASNSPCIDAGSTTAASLGLDTRTTRTDQVVDAGTVDMGYHYPTGILSFTDWTSAAGLSGCTNEYGIAWGDYNNDGYLDLYITKRNALYKNNGDGTFSTQPPYLYCGNRSAHWADYDNDGDLDFGSTYNMYFSINNGDGTFTMQNNTTIGLTNINNLGDFGWLDYNEDGYLDLWAPNGSNPYTYMYTNDGDGTFTGVAGSTIGLTANINGETTVVTDYDGDGHTDILYRASSLYLWHNNGDGTFTDVTSTAGVSLSGTSGGYNGTAFGDYDNDGDLDFYGGQSGSNKLYRNNGDGTFTDVTSTAGVAGANKKTKGVAWGDYDNDGDLDLYVAQENGANQLFQNNGDGTFTDVAPLLGLNDASKSYGVGWADYDLDGDLDLFIGNKQYVSKLFKNNLINDNYFKVKVKGSGSGGAPIDGTGSRVELWNSSGTTLLAIREISGGEGMGSHPPRIAHFGLADAWGGSSGTYQVRVKFTGGNQVVVNNVIPASSSITIGGTTLNHTIEVLEGGLVAEWRMDECNWNGTAGEIADSSGNGLHGSAQGDADTESGKLCFAGVFDGNGDYLLTDNSTILGSSTSMSVALWVNFASTTSQYIIEKAEDSDSQQPAFDMYYSSSTGKLWFSIYSSDSDYYKESYSWSPTIGTWYHIAWVFDYAASDKIKLYIDGTEVVSNLSALGSFSYIRSVSNPIIIGKYRPSDPRWFNGKIDEVQLYTKALTVSEISDIISATRTCRDCIPPDPIAWWQMDECEWTGTSGEVVDSSGNGNNGTRFGDANTGDGKICQAGVFDGSGDYVSVPHSTSLNLENMTVAVWLKRTGDASWKGIVEKGSNNQYRLKFAGNNKINFFVSGYGELTANSSVPVDEWTHIAATFENSPDGNDVIKIYYNGVFNASSTPWWGTPATTSSPLTIGALGSNSNFFSGSIDEVYLYDQTLNKDQIQVLYTETHPCPSCVPEPVASWYMDECAWTGASGEVADSSGNGNDGTVFGGANTGDGKVCNGGIFDGSDDYVTVPDNTILDISGPFTVSAWVKLDDLIGIQPIVVKGGINDRNYLIYTINSNVSYGYEEEGGTNHFYTGTKNLTVGTWYHLVVTWDGSTVTGYVDGVVDGTPASHSATPANGDLLYIGYHPQDDTYINGIIDEVRIFNQALTQSDIQVLYDETHPCPDCIATRTFVDFPRKKWVLMGVPVRPDPADALSVLGDDFDGNPADGTNWQVAHWDVANDVYDLYSDSPGTFPDIIPGLGVWVWQDVISSTTIDVTGVKESDNYSVDLVGPPVGTSLGKNMVSNPYTGKIDWSETRVTDGTDTLSILDAATQNWVNSHAYIWNYSTSMYEVVSPDEAAATDTLSEWEGFWVIQMDDSKDLDLIMKKNTGGGKTLVRERIYVSRYGDEVRRSRRYEEQSLTDWSGILYLHTEDGSYSSLDNRFGVNPNASDEFDGLDASWFAPSAEAYGALYFITSGGIELVHDIRGSEWSENTWHFKVKDYNVNGSWKLRWPNLSSVPGSIQLSLESPLGTVIVPDLRERLSFDFTLSSGSERDFYLKAVVEADSLMASTRIGFVQNPGISRYLDLYLFPDEPLDMMRLFVDSDLVPVNDVDPLFNVYRGSLQMTESGERELVVHMLDLSENLAIDTLLYNFVLAGGSVPLIVNAPGDHARLFIPGGILPEGSWVGLGISKAESKDFGSPDTRSGSPLHSDWDLALGSLYSIQPYGLSLPEGSELVIPVRDQVDDLTSLVICRETSTGWVTVPNAYDPRDGTIHAYVNQSGNYALMRDTGNRANSILPTTTALIDNYPNPFNAVTMIPYTLQEPSHVSIRVYDILGKEVIHLVNEHKEAGFYRQRWNGRDQFGNIVSTGVYFVQFKAGDYVKTKKVMLLK